MANIKLVFSIYGESFDPLQLNILTDVNDSVYWKKGDFIKNKSILRTETAWEYSIESSDVLHFSDIGDKFIGKFAKYTSQIEQYIIENKLKVKIDIVIEIVNNNSPSLYFNQEFIKFISSIKCEFDIDLYILD